MSTFVALYRGPSVSEARLISASGNPELASYVARVLLNEEFEDDPVLVPVSQGRARTLRLVLGELSGDE